MSVSRPNGLVSMGCLHPIATTDSHGTPISVPCRSCAWCRMHQADRNSMLTSLEMLDEGTLTLFVTLTYANEFIPKISFRFDGLATDFVNSDGEVTQTLYSSDKYVQKEQDFLKKLSANYAHRFPQFFRYGEIPVSDISHVQSFLKRIHSRCFRKFKQNSLFRYVYCSEYGESSFRPHYHILLFFKSESVRCFVAKNIRTAWLYGFVHSVYWNGISADYLSTYCVGLSAVAKVYNKGLYRSCFRHSARLGFQTISRLSEVNDIRHGNYRELTCTKNNSDLVFAAPYNYLNTLYPKPRDFSYLSSPILYKRCCFALEYFTKNFTKNELVRAIIADVQHYEIHKDFTLCPHLSNYLTSFDCLSPHSKLLKFLTQCLTSDRIFNHVRYDVNVSFNFLNAAKNFSNSDFALHFRKLCSYYSQRDTAIQEKEKIAYEYLKAKNPDDYALTYFDYNHVPFSKKMDFRNSDNFRAWIAYNSARVVDASKVKKQKEAYTLKPYSTLTSNLFSPIDKPKKKK